jgi:hypothetical protein
MATVILDVPSEKIQSFVSMILQLGIDKHRITSNAYDFETTTSKPAEKASTDFSSLRQRYWDWEIHMNELEFE